ncbi:uncharacterized protein LOC132270456 [Cornus florida]|uniref:uncharacterized protein LOC132270456 n=1 Tax=Cornus florida TaxID=4283 RepID=UPI0028A26BFF|nr:uncharacterized protein LOC132270456 [Cornus florida]
MDKSWIQLPTIDPHYAKGIKDFIEVAKAYVDDKNRTRCPYSKCKNILYRTLPEVKGHLCQNRMDKMYTRWEWHGKGYDMANNNSSEEEVEEEEDGDEVNELLEDICMGPFVQTEMIDVQQGLDDALPNSNMGHDRFQDLLQDAQRELYPGCENFSKLSFVLKLYNMKVTQKLSNKYFTMMLKLLNEAMPKGVELPKSHYEAKNMLRELGFGYEVIHACINDCILFLKEYENNEFCPRCGESRYKSHEGKGKKIPQKILRYFPLKSRLQRLFMSRKISSDMRWHKEKRVKETNIFRHPADSMTWEEFDIRHPWFSAEPRNVRLGLASDRFNPFSNMSNSYSMWPVIVFPYNLPPWKCMKELYLFISLLILGPRSPGKEIDVYLRPLIDELKELWVDGVMTYDASTMCTFRLHVALLWTINDFPTYGDLSGWVTKGYMACPVCNFDAS